MHAIQSICLRQVSYDPLNELRKNNNTITSLKIDSILKSYIKS